MRFIELFDENERALFLSLIDRQGISEKARKQGFCAFDVELPGVPPIMGGDGCGDVYLLNAGVRDKNGDQMLAASPDEPDIIAIRAKQIPDKRIVLPCFDFPARCSVSDAASRPGGMVDLPSVNGVNGHVR